MNYLAGDCKGNLDAPATPGGAISGWILLYTYGLCLIFPRMIQHFELQKNEPKQLKRLSRALNRTPCAGVQMRLQIRCKLRRSGRVAGHEADWSKRVDRLTTLIERGPFDLDDPLRF